MGFNNKKIIGSIIMISLISNVLATNVYATESSDNTTYYDNNITTENTQDDTDQTTTNNDDTDASIIKKLDFEYEIQTMFEKYQDTQEAEKLQEAKDDTYSIIDDILSSSDYSIEEKRQLCNEVLENSKPILTITEQNDIKFNVDYELNRLTDAENLDTTIDKILSSTVSSSAKETFCINTLKLAVESGTITKDEYSLRVEKISADLEVLKEQEQEQLLAKSQAEAKAKAERLSQEQTATTTTPTTNANTTTDTTTQSSSQVQTQQGSINNYNEPATVTTAPETVTEPTTTTTSAPQNTYFNGTFYYNDTDFLALCNVVQHEVGYCSTQSKMMVASVVINRVLSGTFPDNIYDVVTQQNQFTNISSFVGRTDYASEDTIYWCQYVLDNGIDYSNGALYYYAPKWCGYMSYFENMTLVAECDGQRYFKP